MKRGLCVLLALVLPMGTVSAIEIGRGQKELTFSGSGTTSKNFDTGGMSMTAEYGVYLNPRVEAGIRQSLGWSKGAEDSSWSGATRFYLDYHFGSAQWRPYLGASLGGLYGNDTEETWFAGPEAGLKYYVQPAAFLFAQIEYQIFFQGASEISDRLSDGAYYYSFGAGYNF